MPKKPIDVVFEQPAANAIILLLSLAVIPTWFVCHIKYDAWVAVSGVSSLACKQVNRLAACCNR